MAIKKYLDQLERDVPTIGRELEIGGQIASLIQSEADRQDLENVAEVIAFNLVTVRERAGETDEGNHYWPIIISRDESGEMVFMDPDISRINEGVLGHWEARAGESKNPVLRARYADLVVDFSPNILGRNAEVGFSRTVIESNIDICHRALVGTHECMKKIRRALKLAIKINDQGRIAKTKDAVIALEERIAVDGKPGLCGFSVRWLLLEFASKVELSNDEECQLINDLEERLKRVNDTASTEGAVALLSEYYSKKQDKENLMRVLTVLEKNFKSDERWNAEPLLTQAYYGKLAEIYAQYGNFSTEASKASKRIIHEYSQLDLDWQKSMKTVSASVEISQEKINKFLAEIFDENGNVLHNALEAIGNSLVHPKDALEKDLEKAKKEAPLLFSCPRRIISGDGLVNKLSPEDRDGELIHYAGQEIQVMSVFLGLVTNELKRRFSAAEITEYFRESLIFKDEHETYINEAIAAYWGNNSLVASHLFIPMIEKGFRELMRKAGGTYLASSSTKGEDKVLSLSGIFSKDKNPEILRALFSQDIIFCIKVILTEKLGLNLRNDFAHGLDREKISQNRNSDLLFYIMVVLSLVKRK